VIASAAPGGALAQAVQFAGEAQIKAASGLRELMQQNLCLVHFFSNTQPF